ncbi:MAG: hypothetical protein IJJ47_11215 [Methanosphaera sp.]|nr:hypothetical protein [Methanosphaera sp.]
MISVKDKTDLLVIYGAENNIIQTNDTLHLWAFLTDNNGNRLVNEEVSFYKVMGDVETQIGSSVVTDSNGIASLDYVGGGVGQIGIYAKYGTVVSDTYEVIDGVFYNSGVGAIGDASFYNPSSISVDVQSDGTLLTQSASSNALYYANLGSTGDLYDFQSAFCIEFDIVSSSSSSSVLAISVTEKNGTPKIKQFSALNISSNNHIKVIVDGTNVIYQVDNGTPVSEAYSTTYVRVAFLLNNASFKYKNFVIYPI